MSMLDFTLKLIDWFYFETYCWMTFMKKRILKPFFVNNCTPKVFGEDSQVWCSDSGFILVTSGTVFGTVCLELKVMVQMKVWNQSCGCSSVPQSPWLVSVSWCPHPVCLSFQSHPASHPSWIHSVPATHWQLLPSELQG